jgi:hypothetical protein
LSGILRTDSRCALPALSEAATSNGFGSSFNRARIDAGMLDRDPNFNDLRGTAATNTAGFTMREIAETLAREEESVEKIIRRYVDRAAAITLRIKKLEAKEPSRRFRLRLERAKGIEPSYAAWEAAVLPLNYARGCAVAHAYPD